jgi:hypothetical protein
MAMTLSMDLPPGINIPGVNAMDDLLTQQLHEWAEIEDDYDAIPWIITDPREEEHIFDKLDEAIQRHTAHARAGPETGQYWTRLPLLNGRGSFSKWEWFDPKENLLRAAGRWTKLTSEGQWVENQEDVEGRIVINGEMKTKGANYMKATTPYGDCYINLKFTSYVPEIGEQIKMLCRFQDPTRNIPMKCIKILADIDEHGNALS